MISNFPSSFNLPLPLSPDIVISFPSTYAFTALLLASFVPFSRLVSPSFSTHLFSVILLASTFAYVLSTFVVPANSFILAPSRVNLYVVFLVSVVLSGVTVIPEFFSLVTSTASFAISCIFDFLTDNL